MKTFLGSAFDKIFSAVKPCLKCIIEAIDPLYVTLYRRKYRFIKAIPPMHLRVRVGGSRWINEFMNVGLMCANNINEALFAFCEKRIDDYEKILDFGCGCGRILQYLYRDNSSKSIQFYGCDVDANAIRWMQANYSNNNFVVNLFEQPVPFDDSFFDLVYAYSVFTHLDESMQFEWLQDIQRMLRPGGIALLTIHGSKAVQMFIDGPHISESMREHLIKHKPISESGFIFEPYEDLSSDKRKYPGIGSMYGLTFHSHSYIKDHWSNVFEVRGIYSNEEDNFQEVVVLEKKK